MPPLLLAALLPLVPAVRSSASSDAQFAASLAPARQVAADARYELVAKRSRQTLDLLKTLRDFASEVKKGAERLRGEMLDDSYEDWVNTRLLAAVFEARSTDETVDKTYDLEKRAVSEALKTARGGDYGPIEEALARIKAFQDDYEERVKSTDAKVAAVRAAYERHFGNAKAALARFRAIPLVQELLSAKPKLVKSIELAPASLRPLVWRVDFVKEKADYNDPRFGLLPRSISLQDGAETLTYAVVIR